MNIYYLFIATCFLVIGYILLILSFFYYSLESFLLGVICLIGAYMFLEIYNM